MTSRLKPLIGLNGPPRSGKTFILNKLAGIFPFATVIKIQDGMFKMMQEKNVGNAYWWDSYEAYKASGDYDRDACIRFSTAMRDNYSDSVFIDYCESMPEFKQAKLVLFDNIGLGGDHEWGKLIGDPYLLMRIDCPYMPPSKPIEPTKAEMRSLFAPWKNDSRRPFLHDKMLTAYDSVQMSLLIDYLENTELKKDSGPYHECAIIWERLHSLGATV